jgi:hexosaminidase
MNRQLIRFIVISFLIFSSMQVESQTINIIPRPDKVTMLKGSYQLRNNTKIGITSPLLRNAAVYLKQILSPTGYRYTIVKGAGQINLVLSPGKTSPLEESYTLSVTHQKITIKAPTYRGIVNGIASLRQLLPDTIESRGVVKGVAWTVPAVRITDKPLYHWRGLMMDVSRHFFDKKEVEDFLDVMALYKLNKFHWHLTDDQGWRLEIKKYPLLTKKGAWRKLGHYDFVCMDREKKENNPEFKLEQDKFHVIDGDTLYGGYYTQQDIKDIVKYAAVRGIDVVPELDMPGHCLAAVSNYPTLTCAGAGGPLCPGKDSTMMFCKNVYDEVFSLFPFNYVSIGGDEVNMSNWQACPDCQRRIKSEGLKSEVELHAWFIHQMEKHFNDHGKRLIGWDEILEGGLSPTSTVDWWRGDHGDVVQKTTAHGNEAILCPTTFCYFDYMQDDNTIRRLYEGKIVPDSLSARQLTLIKGMQANVWAEFIPSRERQQFQVFPRALALAERAWTRPDMQDWTSFSDRLKSQLKRLDVMKVNYRPLVTTKK